MPLRRGVELAVGPAREGDVLTSGVLLLLVRRGRVVVVAREQQEDVVGGRGRAGEGFELVEGREAPASLGADGGVGGVAVGP